MSRRVLNRPPQGWANHSPNHALPDMLALVAMLFGGALFFNWAALALDALLSI